MKCKEAISLELRFDTLGMNEITQGGRVKARDTDLGLSVSMQGGVACAAPWHAAGPLTTTPATKAK